MDFLKLILPFFPTAYVYKENEIIIEPKNNIYLRIDNINSVLDFECKILEWLSRSCCKGLSDYWQKYFRRGVNSYFRQTWSKDDFNVIYTYLGNNVNRNLCVDFITSGFDLKILNKEKSAIPGAAGNNAQQPHGWQSVTQPAPNCLTATSPC